MGHLLTRTQIQRLVAKHGREVIEHRHMQIERCCYQHGNVTTFEHSVRVACLAVWMADRAHLWYRVDLKSLIRAALLHDYFLYDWHDWDNGEHQWHGFTHGHAALVNALKDFKLNDIERNSIENHMFPMTPVPPRYIEGYLVQDHELIGRAVRLAKACGLTVALDLASFNIVAENLEFLRGLVSEHVDIVFANEDEAKTFTCEAEPLNALQAISQMCELAVVKIGTKGALIKQGEEVVHVGIMAAAKRVDTTGAGDFYAAGFLAGLCDGLSLRQCGTIGAITAGKVIEVVGTTFGEEAWADIHRLVNKVKNEKYLF